MYTEKTFAFTMSSIHRDKGLIIPDHIEEREDFIYHDNTMRSIFNYIKHLDPQEIQEGFNKMMMEKNWHKIFWNRSPTLLEWLSFFKITLITQSEIDQKLESQVQCHMNYISNILNDPNYQLHLFRTKYKSCDRFKGIVNQFCNLKTDIKEDSRMQDMAKYICDNYDKNPKEFYHNLRETILAKIQKESRRNKYEIVINNSPKDLIKIK